MKTTLAILTICLASLAWAIDPYQVTVTNNNSFSTAIRFSSNEVLRARTLLIRGVVGGNITNANSVKILFNESATGGAGIELLPGATLTLDGGPLGLQLYALRFDVIATNDGVSLFILP